MPKLCANLTLLYNELPFLERFRAAARSGFAGVEYLFPYAYPCELLTDLLAENGLVQILHNLPAGDWEKIARYFISRSLEHGVRRAEEMREAAKTVAEAGVAPLMTSATVEREDWAAAFKSALSKKTKLL